MGVLGIVGLGAWALVRDAGSPESELARALAGSRVQRPMQESSSGFRVKGMGTVRMSGAVYRFDGESLPAVAARFRRALPSSRWTEWDLPNGVVVAFNHRGSPMLARLTGWFPALGEFLPHRQHSIRLYNAAGGTGVEVDREQMDTE